MIKTSAGATLKFSSIKSTVWEEKPLIDTRCDFEFR